MCYSGRSRRQQRAQLALKVPRGTEVSHLMLLSPCKLSAAFSERKGTEVTQPSCSTDSLKIHIHWLC